MAADVEPLVINISKSAHTLPMIPQCNASRSNVFATPAVAGIYWTRQAPPRGNRLRWPTAVQGDAVLRRKIFGVANLFCIFFYFFWFRFFKFKCIAFQPNNCRIHKAAQQLLYCIYFSILKQVEKKMLPLHCLNDLKHE